MAKYLDSTGFSYFWSLIKSKFLPDGGTSGQVLAKSSSSNYDADWITLPGSMSYSVVTATLPTTGWSSNSITVNVTGVTASNDVIVMPAPSSGDGWISAGICCTAQGSGTLTFTRTAANSSALTANVMIVSGSVNSANGVGF